MSITIGIGKNLKITPSPTPPPFTYDADLLVYVSGLATPLSDAQMLRLDTLFKGLKSGLGITNLSDSFDIFYILAGETQECSLRNAVKRAHDGVIVPSCPWTQYEGFLSDNVLGHIDSNYNPNTQAVNYSLNNASMGVYSRDYTATGIAMEANDTNISQIRTIGVGADRVYLNDTAYGACAITEASGMFIHCRSTNLIVHNFNNKQWVTFNGAASNAVPNVNFSILTNTVNTTRYIAQLSMAFAGKSFTESECGIIQDNFEIYMDANGKGVIP